MQIDRPEVAPLMLTGHTKEVTAVAWCPSDMTKIATCSDDSDLRLWKVAHAGKKALGEITGRCQQYMGSGKDVMYMQCVCVLERERDQPTGGERGREGGREREGFTYDYFSVGHLKGTGDVIKRHQLKPISRELHSILYSTNQQQ